MEFSELKEKYVPKEDYSIIMFQSRETSKYIAAVFQKTPIRDRFGKTSKCDSSIANIFEANIDKYFEFLKPYIQERL